MFSYQEMGVETLGQAFDAGWRATAKCRGWLYIEKKLFGGCTGTAELAMETLVWTRGRDLPLSKLRTGSSVRCADFGRCACCSTCRANPPPGRSA
jgi:hypothetical protein